MEQVNRIDTSDNIKKFILMTIICGIYCFICSAAEYVSRSGIVMDHMSPEDVIRVFLAGGDQTMLYEGKTDDEKIEIIMSQLGSKKYEVSETAAPASDFTYHTGEYSAWHGCVVGGRDFVCISKYNGTAEVVEIPAMIDGKAVCVIDRDAFADNIYVKKVILPDSVCTIGFRAFVNCKKLEEVEVSSNLWLIDFEAFAGCTSLTSFKCKGDLLSIRIIGERAFGDCTALKKVEINTDELKKVIIGNRAFERCGALESFRLIGASIEEMTLGEAVFVDCINLENAELPENTVSMGGWAFKNCEKLQNIRLDSVNEIAREAFTNCKSLTSFNIPAKALVHGGAFSGCSALTTVTFEEGALGQEEKAPFIGDGAFKGTALTEIEIPGYYEEIGKYAFTECPNLIKVVWHNSGKNVTNQSIGEHAFIDSPQLKEVYLPRTLGNIGVWDWVKMADLTIFAMEGSEGHKFAIDNGAKWENWTE